MVLIALAILGLAQTQAGPLPAADQAADFAAVSSPEIYHRPAIPPYEPPSDFGRHEAEGDSDTRSRRLPGRADAVQDYQVAVESRRSAAQALMGTLDGLWRLTDARGRTLLELALVDTGSDRAVEGAWTRTLAHRADRSGLVQSVEQDMGAVRIQLDDDTLLTLVAESEGWSGIQSHAGRDRPVRLSPVSVSAQQ